MYFKILYPFTCFAVTADDANGNTRKSFNKGDKIYILRKIVHENGKTMNAVCPDYLLLDVELRNVYPLVNLK